MQFSPWFLLKTSGTGPEATVFYRCLADLHACYYIAGLLIG